MKGLELEVVTLGNGITESDLLVHNDSDPNPLYAFALSRMDTLEGFPTPIGVLRGIEGTPRYEDLINDQIKEVQAKRGKGDLGKLLRAGDTWEVRA
jgi:2-oxoglutarate/2-oxoacid ferredoxin oxidoreductase subunit beta